MIQTIKFLTIALLGLPSLCFANQDWTFCYNQKQNRVYFQTEKDLQQNQGKCLGRTYYQGKKNFTLITDEQDAKGFPKGLPGTAINMNIRTGEHVLITQWNDLSKSNTLIVLEADLKNNQVKQRCRHENFSETFQARYNEKKSQFEILIREPVSTYSETFHKVWKKCF